MRLVIRLAVLLLLYTLSAPRGFAHPLPAEDTIPKVSVSPVALSFGRVAIGETRQLTISITNPGGGPVLHDSVEQLNSPFILDSGGQPMNLETGQEQLVYLTFKPLYVGQFADSLIIHTNSDSAHQRIVVYLFGTGYVPDTIARIQVTPLIVDFGIVYTGQSKPANVTIKNVTNTGLKLSGNVLNAHAPFFVTVGLGNFLIDSGASKQLTVQCAPTDTGSYRDSIIINSSTDEATKRIVVILRAHVHSADELLPKIYVSSSKLDFGTYVIHSSQEVQLNMTIKNVSDTQRTLIMNLLFPHNPFAVTGANDHVELIQNQAQDLVVHFNPPIIGDYKDSIIIVSNSARSRIPVYLVATVITTQDVTSTDAEKTVAVRTSPNPCVSVVLVRFDSRSSAPAECSVYDEAGRLVLTAAPLVASEGENTFPLEVSQLVPGTYHGVLSTADGVRVFKFVVTH